jgi:hypothetical protein
MEHFLVRIENGRKTVVDQYYNASSLRSDAKRLNKQYKDEGKKVKFTVMSENKVMSEGLF